MGLTALRQRTGRVLPARYALIRCSRHTIRHACSVPVQWGNGRVDEVFKRNRTHVL